MKKLRLIGVALTLALMFSLVSAIPAYASSSDSYYTYTIYFNLSSEQPTEARNKENDTSVYINNYSYTSLYVRTFGRVSSDYSWVNRTINGHATIPHGEYFIWQTIYENGGRQARLGLTTQLSSASGATVSGAWSPDSVGSYPVANS
jgi:hypothetical protein